MHPERILLGIPLVFVVAIVGGILLVLASLGRRATRFGYPSRGRHLHPNFICLDTYMLY
jgi:hypothetical protein